MRTTSVYRWTLALLSAAFFVGFLNCAKTSKNEIPITTSSKEALQAFLRGRELFDDVRVLEALPYFEKAVKLDSNFASAYLNLAQASNIYDFNKYLYNLNKAESLADKVSEGEKIQILLARTGLSGNVPKQKDLLEQLAAMYPKDKRAHYQLASFNNGQRDYAKAIEQYQKAVELDPKFAMIYNEMAYCYLYDGNLPEAEKAIKQYVQLKPNEPNPYDSFAEILMKEGKFEESIRNYEKALALNPDFTGSYIGIGTDYVLLNKPDEARKEIQKLFDRAKTDGIRQQALYAMVNSFVDEGNFPKSLETLQKSYEISEKNKDAANQYGDLATMGYILMESGKLKDAENMFSKAIVVVRKSDLPADIKNNIEQDFLGNSALLALKNGDSKTAKIHAEKLRVNAESLQNPNRLRNYHNVEGRIALQEKRFDAAITEFQQASQRSPDVLFRTGEAYFGKGDMAKAKECWEKAAHFNEIASSNAFVRKQALQRLETHE